MCPDIIFQILLPHSRPYDITSCDCDVMCLFIAQKKRKQKENKILIKSENKRKRKKNCLCPKHSITTLLFPAKNSWDFSKKSKCDDIINTWKITFQASDLKGNNFLDLVNGNNKILEPLYCKGRTWLQFFGHSNLLCARVTRAIMNHAPCYDLKSLGLDKKNNSCIGVT